jgi:hypothetical protein
MANTHQAMDCTDQRRPSIGERFLRFIGFPAEMPQMDPAELKAVLALRGVMSFTGLPISAFVVGLVAARDTVDAPQAENPAPSCRPVSEETLMAA